jgi:hypothetical protein
MSPSPPRAPWPPDNAFYVAYALDLKEMKAADAGLAVQARKVAVIKKGLAD